ncbi:MAG: M13 family metallopeptidase [Clostridiales bacterium]|nr:M13 family metallopeptidase [Clostridiales bacterium]
MKRMKVLTVLCAAALLLSGCSNAVDVPQTEPVETLPVEEGPVRPQDDFYRYVNGETLADAEFAYGSGTAADALDDDAVVEAVEQMIADVSEGSGYQAGSEEYIVQNLYNLYLDYDFDNAGVPEELDQLFHEIDDAETLEEFLLLDASVSSEYGTANTLNLSVGVNYHGQYDAVLTFYLMGDVLGADLGELSGSYDALDTIRDNASNYLQAVGHDEEEADGIGTDLAYLMLDLYNAVPSEQYEDNGEEYFQLYTAEQIDEILTNVDLDAYITAMGVDTAYADEFGVYAPDQLQALNGMLTEENLPALKAWAIGRLMITYGRFVNSGYDSLHVYSSVSNNTPEEDACSTIMKEFGVLLDPLYAERFYSEENDEALRDMCEDIREQYRILITQADWLTQGTRDGLLDKLDNMLVVTGMDVQRLDRSITGDLDYTDYFTLFRSLKTLGGRLLNQHLTGSIDRRSIEMRMYEVNACYVPNLNTITITVASSIDPIFDVNGDYYDNLGGLGATIAHEMGHAFDSNCILYDSNGVYNPSWLAPEDTEALEQRNEQAVRYFEDNFVIFGIYHIDGEQTLGENYADLGGLEAIAGIPETDEQRQIMFESYARSWCALIVDEVLIGQIANDVHSPSWIRVNAMLSTLEVFYETYDVQEGDGMYIAPGNRISRWY